MKRVSDGEKHLVAAVIAGRVGWEKQPARRWRDKGRGPGRPQRFEGVEVFPGLRVAHGPAASQFVSVFNGLYGPLQAGGGHVR